MFATYSAGKHAVEAISQSLRFEMADLGVKVACVEPGEVQSAIWAKGDEVLARGRGRRSRPRPSTATSGTST